MPGSSSSHDGWVGALVPVEWCFCSLGGALWVSRGLRTCFCAVPVFLLFTHPCMVYPLPLQVRPLRARRP